MKRSDEILRCAQDDTSHIERKQQMANKYSKSNNSSKASEAKTMQDYEERRKKLNRGAKIMAIVLIASMVVFYVISAGLFLMD